MNLARIKGHIVSLPDLPSSFLYLILFAFESDHLEARYRSFYDSATKIFTQFLKSLSELVHEFLAGECELVESVEIIVILLERGASVIDQFYGRLNFWIGFWHGGDIVRAARPCEIMPD